MRSNRTSGFSLVELMVVLVILGVLLGLGLPSFRRSVDSNRVATAANELTAALSLARSEAMRSTRQAILCPTNDGSSCVTANWNRGWLVALDTNRDGTPDQTVRVIQPKDGVNLSVTGPTDSSKLVFTARGQPDTGGATVTLELQPNGCTSGLPLRRTLTMNVSGQVRLTSGYC